MRAQAASEMIHRFIAPRASPSALAWLEESLEAARAGKSRTFLMAFSGTPRHFPRMRLALSAEERRAAADLRRGFDPGLWTLDQSVRTLLVLSLPHEEGVEYRRRLDTLFDDGDIEELVALYQALPLLPHASLFRERAAEGLRSNMRSVFEAVALNNPYVTEELPDLAFNQLVLKCLFIESPLDRVWDLDCRVNTELARMLVDYAHERWAAGRAVSPELWRCVGPVASGSLLDALHRVLQTGTNRERTAAALSCRNNTEAGPLRSAFPDLFAQIETSPPSWGELAKKEP